MNLFRLSNKYYFLALFIGLSFIVKPFAIASSVEDKLTFYTENYPPSNYLHDNNLVGVSVEILKRMWQEMHVKEQKIYLVPWARGYSNALHRANSVLFTMARTPQREALFKWVGPIYTAEHVLVAKKNFKEKIITFDQVHKYSIAAIKDDISEITLIEHHFPEEKIALITRLQQAILLLENNRIDLIIVSRSSLKELLIKNNITMNNLKIVYSVNKVGNYYAFNNQTPDLLIQQYQAAFDAIKTERDAILASYNLFY